jgi:hypothetical protein
MTWAGMMSSRTVFTRQFLRKQPVTSTTLDPSGIESSGGSVTT